MTDDYIFGQLFVKKYKTIIKYSYPWTGDEEVHIRAQIFIRSDINNNQNTFVDIIGWIIFFLALVQFILSTYRMKLQRIEQEKKQLLILNKGDDVNNLDQAKIEERLREEINKVKEQ